MSKMEKKKKAAIAAVISYLEQKEERKVNKWVKLGRVIIMRNNISVQTKKIKKFNGGI